MLLDKDHYIVVGEWLCVDKDSIRDKVQRIIYELNILEELLRYNGRYEIFSNENN